MLISLCTSKAAKRTVLILSVRASVW